MVYFVFKPSRRDRASPQALICSYRTYSICTTTSTFIYGAQNPCSLGSDVTPHVTSHELSACKWDQSQELDLPVDDRSQA